jgi:nucleotide-binding universal stress UspA family protein
MFFKIVIALNDLPESQRAIRTAIELRGNLPAYTSFAIVVDPSTPNETKETRCWAHGELHEKASLLVQEHGVRTSSSIVERREVQVILHFPKDERADLLVFGLHQHDFYLSVFGVPFMTSHMMLPAGCSVCIEHTDRDQRDVSVEMGLAFGGNRA